jgi:hypothetical protein
MGLLVGGGAFADPPVFGHFLGFLLRRVARRPGVLTFNAPESAAYPRRFD